MSTQYLNWSFKIVKMTEKEYVKSMKKFLRLETKPPKIETTKKTYNRKSKHKKSADPKIEK